MPILDGVMLYRDGGHVSSSGAVYLGRYIRFPDVGRRQDFE